MDSNHIKILCSLHRLFFCVLLILIIPGLVPQPEPYFDLTPIRVTHTKIILPKHLNL